jgi:type IV secretion system protein VirB6
MSGSCAISTDMGAIRDVLATVDCNTRDFARLGYDALTAQSQFQNILTAMLVVYVALIGYRMLFASDGARLSDGPGIALKIGTILVLVTNWNVFQTLVFDIASKAPLEIAALITAPFHGALASHPVAGVQAAYDTLSTAAQSLGKSSPATAQTYASQSTAAADALAIASGILFMSSAGLIAVATIAIGVLTAIGPIFIALFLFLETRGLFVGWVRALAASAFALLSGWVLIVLMLSALQPWLVELAGQQDAGHIDVQTAITTSAVVFVFAAAEAGLVLAGIIVARGFDLRVARRSADTRQARGSGAQSQLTPFELSSRPARLAEQLQQRDAREVWSNRAAATARLATPASRTVRAGDVPTGAAYRRTTRVDDARLRGLT